MRDLPGRAAHGRGLVLNREHTARATQDREIYERTGRECFRGSGYEVDDAPCACGGAADDAARARRGERGPGRAHHRERHHRRVQRRHADRRDLGAARGGVEESSGPRRAADARLGRDPSGNSERHPREIARPWLCRDDLGFSRLRRVRRRGEHRRSRLRGRRRARPHRLPRRPARDPEGWS